MRKLLAFLLFCSVGIACAQSTVLSGTTILTGTTKLALNIPTLNPGWTVIQDTGDDTCVSGTSCQNRGMQATISGTVWVMCVNLVANVQISTITGTGSSGWTVQSSTHMVDTTTGNYMECATSTAGTAGAGPFTVNLTATNGAGFFTVFFELLPPPGYTGSFDNGAVNLSNNVITCTTCTAASVVTTATDAVVRVAIEANTPRSPNFWSSPYLTSQGSEGIGLNIPPGTDTPTFTQSPTGIADDVAVALKSTAITFNNPGPKYKLVNLTLAGGGNGLSCTPACTSLTIPSTTAGNLLFIYAANLLNGVTISSINDGHSGTYSFPSGAGTCSVQVTHSSSFWAQRCGYTLSVPGGVTSLTITMSGNGTTGFLVTEYSRNDNKAWTLDTQNSSTTASPTSYTACPSLTFSGTDDLVFLQYTQNGGPWAPTNYFVTPYPGTGVGVLNAESNGLASIDMMTYQQCTIFSPQTGVNNPMAIALIAFQ